jgi:hypothetical protein
LLLFSTGEEEQTMAKTRHASTDPSFDRPYDEGGDGRYGRSRTRDELERAKRGWRLEPVFEPGLEKVAGLEGADRGEFADYAYDGEDESENDVAWRRGREPVEGPDFEREEYGQHRRSRRGGPGYDWNHDQDYRRRGGRDYSV